MGAGHGSHQLYVPRRSPVHALPAQVKLTAAAAFVLVVVSTPDRHVGAFAGYAVLLVVTSVGARIPLTTLGRRLVVEIPFVAFAVLLPFVGRGDRLDVLGVSLSVSGLWGAWNILAKATLGVATCVLLASTTELRDLAAGLDRLRMPGLIVQIMMLMIRYADVIVDEMRRRQLARVSRGFVARDLRQVPTLARSLAPLFIRSYERGERVHLAMVSRGYTGRMPIAAAPAGPTAWATGFLLPGAAGCVAAAAWIVG
jgi:cobalt/nickel transport system permease protein